MNEILQSLRKGRLFSDLRVSLCADDVVMELGGQKLRPDDSKAYVKFLISHGYPSVTAYTTALHPGTVAKSHGSMLHQVFNLSHLMRANDSSPDKTDIPRDYILGAIVAVELANPVTPAGGWQITSDPAKSTAIRAAAVIHKNAERVPKILGEYLAGRKKWTVSMEVEYSLANSGFLVGQRGKAKKQQAELMDGYSTPDMAACDLGFVPCIEAPDELLETFDLKKRAVTKPWSGLPVTLMIGGINGEVHYSGVGLVSVGAEKEAEIERILASDPDQAELGTIFRETDEVSGAVLDYYKKSEEISKKLLTQLASVETPET